MRVQKFQKLAGRDDSYTVVFFRNEKIIVTADDKIGPSRNRDPQNHVVVRIGRYALRQPRGRVHFAEVSEGGQGENRSL